MTEPKKTCQFCLYPLTDNATTCPACGQPVRSASGEDLIAAEGVSPNAITPEEPDAEGLQPESIPPEPPSAPASPAYRPAGPPPAPAFIPASAAPAAPRKKSKLPLILGIGCLGLLCLGALAAVAFFTISNSNSSYISEIVFGTATALPTATELPTAIPMPTEEPTWTPEPEPTDTPEPAAEPTEELTEPTDEPQTGQVDETGLEWSPSIGQFSEENMIIDDFSNNDMEWADYADSSYTLSFQNEHYQMHVIESDYAVWAYLPTEFIPTTIEFEAAVVADHEVGAYGILCNYQDEDNYHYMLIDPDYQEYSLGYKRGGDYYELEDDLWKESAGLNPSTVAVNKVTVQCNEFDMLLMINNELEAIVTLEDWTEPGDMALYAVTWEGSPEQGFKVLFDNVTAFRAVQ